MDISISIKILSTLFAPQIQKKKITNHPLIRYSILRKKLLNSIESCNSNLTNSSMAMYWRTIEWRNWFETRQSVISYGRWAAKHVLLCAWRKSGTGCRGLNSPLAPACFQHFGQLPVACKRCAISPLSNLVLAAYHRSDDQITWPPSPGYESKFKPSNSIARSVLLQKCFTISFVHAR